MFPDHSVWWEDNERELASDDFILGLCRIGSLLALLGLGVTFSYQRRGAGCHHVPVMCRHAGTGPPLNSLLCFVYNNNIFSVSLIEDVSQDKLSVMQTGSLSPLYYIAAIRILPMMAEMGD